MALEQFQNNEAPAEIPAEAPVKKEEPSQESLYANDAALRLHQKRAEYDKHLQTLIDKASQRQTGYNPKLMALGAGLLTPGKTGSFFEGLGTGTKGYLEAGEAEQKNEMEKAKLENELRTGQIGQLEKDYTLERELAGDQYLRALAARRLKEPSSKLAVSDVSGKISPRDILGAGSSGSYGTGPGGLITQEDIMLAPKGAQERIIADYKRQQEDIKIAQDSAKSTEVSVPFIGTQKISIQQQQDISRIVNSPQYQALPPSDKKAVMRQYYADNGIGEVQPEDTTTTKVSSTPSTEMETSSEKANRLEVEKATGIEAGKKNVDREQNFYTAADSSQQRLISANNVERIAKTNPKFFDTLQNPNVIDALGRLVTAGVQTPYGSFGLDAKDASAALGNLLDDVGVSSLLGLNKTGITKTDREAYALFLRDLAIMQVAQRRSSNAVGQGSISDYEQRLFASTTFMKDDDSRVQQLKAKMIRAQAEMDQDLAGLLTDWREKNPHKAVNSFLYSSPEFKQFKKNYEGKLEKIRNANADLFGEAEQKLDTKKSSLTSQPKAGGLFSQLQEEQSRRQGTQ